MEVGKVVNRFKEQFKAQAAFLAAVIALLWILKIMDGFLPSDWSLKNLGIRPRQIASLPCIALAPFIHGSMEHLGQNSVPLFVLGWLVLLSGMKKFLQVTGAVAVISGLGIWLLGSSSTAHFGASGVIFGYLGFLLARGWFERKLLSVAVAIVVGLVYIGFILQLLVVEEKVSWSGHFFGFIGGIVCAWWIFHRNPGTPNANVAGLPPPPPSP